MPGGLRGGGDCLSFLPHGFERRPVMQAREGDTAKQYLGALLATTLLLHTQRCRALKYGQVTPQAMRRIPLLPLCYLADGPKMINSHRYHNP